MAAVVVFPAPVFYEILMTELVPLIAVDDLPEGSSAECVAEGRIFAAYNVNGEFFVIDGICPHAGGPLGEGVLDGHIVTCPWHGWQFDVKSGTHCLNSRLSQSQYEPVVSDGMVAIRRSDIEGGTDVNS